MKKSSAIAVVLAVAVIAGAVWWLASQPAAGPQGAGVAATTTNTGY